MQQWGTSKTLVPPGYILFGLVLPWCILLGLGLSCFILLGLLCWPLIDVCLFTLPVFCLALIGSLFFLPVIDLSVRYSYDSNPYSPLFSPTPFSHHCDPIVTPTTSTHTPSTSFQWSYGSPLYNSDYNTDYITGCPVPPSFRPPTSSSSFLTLTRKAARDTCTLVTVTLVVTSTLTSTDVSLTSGIRSPDETDGTVGSVTQSMLVRFTSNFVHLHSLPLLQERVMSQFSLINFFLPKFLLDVNLENTDGKGNIT